MRRHPHYPEKPWLHFFDITELRMKTVTSIKSVSNFVNQRVLNVELKQLFLFFFSPNARTAQSLNSLMNISSWSSDHLSFLNSSLDSPIFHSIQLVLTNSSFEVILNQNVKFHGCFLRYWDWCQIIRNFDKFEECWILRTKKLTAMQQWLCDCAELNSCQWSNVSLTLFLKKKL